LRGYEQSSSQPLAISATLAVPATARLQLQQLSATYRKENTEEKKKNRKEKEICKF
jgi:hypothetical protein